MKFNQRNVANTFSAKEIAKKFGKNAKDVNLALLNLGFIKKCDNGYNVTDVGRYYGGMQKISTWVKQATTNWLFAEGIAYAYEKRVPIKEDVYCDFYIPKGKIYIEFWGYEDDEAYIKRKEQKIELYKKYGLNLIEIDNDKIGNLDDHLPKELLKFGVSLNL